MTPQSKGVLDFEKFELQSRVILKEIFKAVEGCEHLLPFEGADFDFDLMFVDDKKIQEINAQYRNIDLPTDVITFALFFDCEDKIVTGGVIHLGEIIISIETAQKQADEHGVELEREVLTLIAHGILHLLGFDHQTEIDYEFVVKMQNQVIASLWKA